MPSKFTINGTVINSKTEKGISGLRVEAWDKDLIFDDLVGSATTDKNGKFQIKFTEKYFSEIFFDRKPDLYFKIFKEDELIENTHRSVSWNISDQDINIVIKVNSDKVVPGDDPAKGIVISGVVSHSNGNVVSSIAVRISQQLLRDKKTIGEKITGDKGEYSVTIKLPVSNAAIIVEAIDPNQKIIAASPVIFAPVENQIVNLTITDEGFKGKSFYLQNNAALRSYWKELEQTAITKKTSVDDIIFIANQTAKEPLDVWHYVHANELEKETEIPSEVFFGLFKYGLPTYIPSLLDVKSSTIREALKNAVTQNFISGQVSSNIGQILSQWNSYRGHQLLNLKPGNTDASLADILSLVVRDEKTHQQIINSYVDNDDNIDTLWKNLPNIVGEENAKQMRLAMDLASFSGIQPAMTRALYTDAVQTETNDPFSQLARMNTDDWIDYINKVSKQENKSVVPSMIVEKTEKERVAVYAGILASDLERKYPTQSFFGNLDRATAETGAFKIHRDDLISFFKRNPDFNIKTTPTISIAGENSKADFTGIQDKAAIAKELQSIQRLASYTTSFRSMSTLKEKGLDSAQAILQVPKSKFVADFSSAFESQQACIDIHNQAAANYMQALALFGYVHPSLHSTGVTPNAPNLKEMFGSLDACDCEQCSSIFSAAAYFADCLDLLFDKEKDVYDELMRRRPDLVKIILNCTNTNTPMPYVDLVLERLENFSLEHLDATTLNTLKGAFPKDPFFTNPDYQTTSNANELAANPEHLNYSAYEQLKKTLYPQQLPFNLPLEEARVYLKHLGVERHQLMTTYFNGDTIAAFNDFAICMERLQISPEETTILTGATTGDGSATGGPWNFYGFDKASAFAPITDPFDSFQKKISTGSWDAVLAGRVDVFLQQTGITYKDLITLRLCDFINPIDMTGNREIEIIAKATDEDGNAVDSDTCQLDLLELKGLDKNKHLKKIYRFIRLWKKSGWTMYQIDLAAKSFPVAADTVAEWAKLLTRISQTDFLCKELGLPVESVLAFYSDIDATTTYIDYFSAYYPSVLPLYEKLFQNKQIIFPVDTDFKLPIAAGNKLDNHTPAILAALQINSKDYTDLKSDTSVVPDNNLTLANLSSLYRHAVLAKKLGLGIKDFLACKSLIGINPFTDPSATFTFLSKIDTLKSSGFSVTLVNYLLSHKFEAETGIAPEDEEIGLFISELRFALRAIKEPTASEKLVAPIAEKFKQDQVKIITQKFAEKLKISTNTAAMLLKTYLKSIAVPANFIQDDFWSPDFSATPLLKTYNDPLDASKETEPSKFVRANPVNATQVMVPALFDDYIRVAKIAVFINLLRIKDDELKSILENTTVMGCTDFTTLPVAAVKGDFNKFEVLIKLIRARDLLPLGTPSLFDIINHAITPAAGNSVAWLNDLISRTNWDRDVVTQLVLKSDLATNDGGILKAGFPNDFRNGDLMLRIGACLTLFKLVALKPGLVSNITQLNIGADTSSAIKNAVKSKYDELQWLKLAKPLRDALRERQREALVAYTIFRANDTKDERWKNSNELYSYLLIDVERKPLALTSRIKQAICSLQLYIDRVLMNLEFEKFDISKKRLQLHKTTAEQWNEWRRVYRIWEANRKVFCYPENYILPELRSGKSPIFKDLETELNQNELNDDNVMSAFAHYLEQLDEVARLEIVGLYRHTEPAPAEGESVDTLHVFGRTYSHPQKYFHCKWEDHHWSPWMKLEIDVDGSHIVPVVFNGRLCLFWLFFDMKSVESNSVNTSGDINSPGKYWQIHVAWSVYHKGRWKAKRLSKSFIETEKLFSFVSLQNRLKEQIFVKTEITKENILRLHVQDVHAVTRYTDAPVRNFISGAFEFESINSEPVVSSVIFNLDSRDAINDDAVHFPCIPPSATELKDMQFVMNTNPIPQNFYVDHAYDKNDTGYQQVKKDPGWGVLHFLTDRFSLSVPANFKINPLETEFFFQDSKSTFYVVSNFTSVITDNSPGIWKIPGIVEHIPPPFYRRNRPDPGPVDRLDYTNPEIFFQNHSFANSVLPGKTLNNSLINHLR